LFVLQLKNTKFNDKTIQRYLFFFGVRVVTLVVGQLLEEGVDGGGKLAEGLSVFGLVLKKRLKNSSIMGKQTELKQIVFVVF
jgi:hypothetical protein